MAVSPLMSSPDLGRTALWQSLNPTPKRFMSTRPGPGSQGPARVRYSAATRFSDWAFASDLAFAWAWASATAALAASQPSNMAAVGGVDS